MLQSLKKIEIKILLFLIFFIVSLYSHAQDNDYKFEKISVKDGLPHNNVYTILQDQLGYLWFGTQDGLAKYDGYKFSTYRHEATDSNSLSTGNFGKILQDSSGIYWFGTFGGGLDRFNPKTNVFKNFAFDPFDPNSLGSNQILFVFEDNKNQIWIGTSTGGLNKFNKKEQNFTRYQADPNVSNSLSNMRAKCICESSDGTLWIGTGSGLNKYNPITEDFTVFLHDPSNPNSLSSNNIQHLYVDENDIIWLACRNSGISSFNPKTNKFKHFKHDPNDSTSISDNNSEYIFKDSYNNFWIGTYSGGLNKFDQKTEKFIRYTHDPKDINSISHNEIEYIYEDASHNLWIATRGGGLNKLDLKPKKFNNVIPIPNNINSLQNPSVMAINTDSVGNILIGTDGGGLSILDLNSNSYRHLRNNPDRPNSISLDRVWSIHIDDKGIIWAGTYKGGLNRIELKNGKYNFTHYRHNSTNSESISDDQINYMLEDNKGNLWFATSNGLNKIIKTDNPKTYKFKRYYQNPEDSALYVDNYINSLFIDSNNKFWVASYSGGLFQFIPEKEEFIKFSPADFETSEFKREIRVYVVCEDQNHNLLLGTESNGIIMFDVENKNFKPHPKNEYFIDNMIVGILEDSYGNYWISNSRGLLRYSKKTDIVDFYTHANGFISGGFNRNAIHKAKDGRILVGSNSGLTHFYPLQVTNNLNTPNVVITDFLVLNKSTWSNYILPVKELFNENMEIELRKKDYFFSIEFAALDFTNPEENSYKYKLENFDENWIESNHNRIATYTNLDPGTYTFKVIGSNNDKVWNEKPTELIIKVIPPFYRKKWFLVVVILLISTIVIGLIRLRLNNLIRDKKILEEKVVNRTIEISQQKEELSTQADNLAIVNSKLEDQQSKLEILVHERTQDLEIAKEKAEESDRLKSAFLANMSHEIRTPMNAIIGFSDLIVNEEIELNNKKELSALIQENSYSLLTLIENIIDIAKIESDQLVINKRQCIVNHIFKEALSDFENIIQSKSQVKVKFIDPQLQDPLIIENDTYRLTQILKNLLSNAIKFTEKGAIEIGYKLDNSEASKQIYFFVKDSGIGLTPNQQQEIFSRFTKIEDDKTKMFRGAGLGLAITKHLVELLGGEIMVESEINKGSLFSFYLPNSSIEVEKKEKKEEKQTSNHNWSNKTILITEDEESNFKYLEMIIKKTKANVIWVKTGLEAVVACKQNNIDLVLMDIKIPEMDGLEATRTIKKEYPELPIIAQTAFAMENDEQLSIDAGCDSYLSKPIKARDLLETLSAFFKEE